jgi:arginyl-tRNA synthetase
MIELRNKLSAQISDIVLEQFCQTTTVELTVPESQFGDFATNIAMRLSGQLGQPPREIAEVIAGKLTEAGFESSVAGPGFINIRLMPALLEQEIQSIVTNPAMCGQGTLYKNQVIITEYSDMNAFKTAHAGHLYTTIVGDVVSNLLETQGAVVKRTNFGGDVGLHVGKAMWAIMKKLSGEIAVLDSINPDNRASWISTCYVEGNEAYETDEQAKAEIIECNKSAYLVQETDDHESLFARVYWQCRTWSYEGFEQFYDKLELSKPAGQTTHFQYYPESETAPFGKKLVQEGLERGVFKESQGAVVYEGEQDGLHTRVFLTAAGLPTYETKDLGLAVRKWQDHHFDLNIIITANEIAQYMKVVLAALKHFEPEIQQRTHHMTHGMVKLAGGVKMSSRKGTVVTPDEIINAASQANKEISGKDDPGVVLGAIKYSFLKHKIGGDIVYDPKESVSILGNSGPYLQYAHARARSILAKSDIQNTSYSLDATERNLVRKIVEYSEVVVNATKELSPHIVCTYLYELAQEFNRFYESNKVIGSEREAERLTLVTAYVTVLKNGLTILGIKAPESM